MSAHADPGITGSPRLLIVGCARSGTSYTASLLSAVGLSVGHERTFGPGAMRPGPGSSHEVSWLAVPQVEHLKKDWIVLHQVRDPLPVVSSTLAIGMFPSRTAVGHRTRFWINQRRRRPLALSGPSYVDTVHRALPGLWKERTSIDRAFRYWLEWNRMAARHARSSHRVEDLDELWLDDVLRLAGAQARSRAQLRQAIETVPTSKNHRGKGPTVAFSDISSRRLRSDVVALATTYGYY